MREVESGKEEEKRRSARKKREKKSGEVSLRVRCSAASPSARFGLGVAATRTGLRLHRAAVDSRIRSSGRARLAASETACEILFHAPPAYIP